MKKNKLKYFTGFLAFVFGIVLIMSCQPDYEPEVFAYPEFSITDFTPKTGMLGSEVTITGTNFGDRTEPASVSINGIAAEFVSYSDTEIVVIIPQEAATGPLEVKVWTKIDSTETFTVLPTPAIVSAISQGSDGEDVAAPGETVIISGVNFYTDPERVAVKFNGTPAEITSLESTSMEVLAPEGYATGRITVSFDDFTLEAPFMAPTVETRIKKVLLVTKSTESFDIAVADSINAYKDGNFFVFSVSILAKSVIEESDLAQLNAADVVIMGRHVPSNSYGGVTRDVWDAITRPVLSMNMWGLRDFPDRAKWFPTTTIVSVEDENASLSAIVVADPVFDGVLGTLDWWDGKYNILPADPLLAGNGTILASAPDSTPLFIRWDANVEFYDGAGHSPKGIRTFMGCGNDSGGSPNYFGFSDAAKKVFFNELVRMAKN